MIERSRIARAISAVVALAMFATAFVAAPRSCEGGLELYFGVGVAAVIVMGALPFIVGPPGAPAKLPRAFGFVALGTAVWIVGLLVANVRIMCRLF